MARLRVGSADETVAPLLERAGKLGLIKGVEAGDVVVDVVDVERQTSPSCRSLAAASSSVGGDGPPSKRGRQKCWAWRVAVREIASDRGVVGAHPAGRRREQEANRKQHQFGHAAYPSGEEGAPGERIS